MAITKSNSRVFAFEVETLATVVAVFCGLGFVVLVLLATNGLDMSAGFF
jgi:hypothetical protein